MITVRRVEVPDVPAIQRLISSSFDIELHPYLRSTQIGAEWFLQVFVTYPDSYPDHHYLLAESDQGNLLGFAEFRLTEKNVGFLSYICVETAARGQGVATLLIRNYLNSMPQVRSVQLDVFCSNVPAISLYRKLGFREGFKTVWLIKPFPITYESSPVIFDNIHLSLATFERYGFCEFSITYKGRILKLGRMGQAVLRCFRQEDFVDEDLLGNLSNTFPELKKVFMIINADQKIPDFAGIGEINHSMRMSWNLVEPKVTNTNE